MQKKLTTITQLAKLARCHRRTVTRAIKEGKILADNQNLISFEVAVEFLKLQRGSLPSFLDDDITLRDYAHYALIEHGDPELYNPEGLDQLIDRGSGGVIPGDRFMFRYMAIIRYLDALRAPLESDNWTTRDPDEEKKQREFDDWAYTISMTFDQIRRYPGRPDITLPMVQGLLRIMPSWAWDVARDDLDRDRALADETDR